MINRTTKMSLEEIAQEIARTTLGHDLSDAVNAESKNIFHMISWIGDDHISKAMLRFVLRKKLQELDDEFLYFTEDEFEYGWKDEYYNELGSPPNKPEWFCSKIEKDTIDVAIKSPYSIAWLNELLETPSFYDKYIKAKKRLSTNRDIDILASVTENFRMMDFNSLEYYNRIQQCPVRNLHVSVEYFSVSTARRLQKNIRNS